jgi:hypothetical protein
LNKAVFITSFTRHTRTQGLGQKRHNHTTDIHLIRQATTELMIHLNLLEQRLLVPARGKLHVVVEPALGIDATGMHRRVARHWQRRSSQRTGSRLGCLHGPVLFAQLPALLEILAVTLIARLDVRRVVTERAGVAMLASNMATMEITRPNWTGVAQRLAHSLCATGRTLAALTLTLALGQRTLFGHFAHQNVNFSGARVD